MAERSHEHVGEIARVLHHWIPIWNKPAPGETYELSSHALILYAALRDGQDVARVAMRLESIRIEEFGFPADPETDRQTASGK